MDDAKSQLIDKLKAANNVLVTVRRDPSVDQLSALLGLTLLLNRQGKHAAAVFSGQVPSTIEFLQPEETIEKNTDSLRDFIIALDKSKADKLRYKVEDNVVRIFITPYKTSISQEDLDFSQGDFNVDLVVALGVQQQADLDQAITAHGRILHDATISTINTAPDGDLGSINWHDPTASSLSELVAELVEGLDGALVDNQIATALLTGIVAETNRFSNEKTSPQTMSISAMLMSAGANQQLVASKLEEPTTNFSNTGDSGPLDIPTVPDEPVNNDGAIQIDHGSEPSTDEQLSAVPAPDQPVDVPQEAPQPSYDMPAAEAPFPEATVPEAPAATLFGTGNKRITEPPQLGGMLTANTQPEQLAPSIDPMGLPTTEPPQLFDHKQQMSDAATTDVVPPAEPPVAPEPIAPAPQAARPDPVIPGLTPPPPAWVPPMDNPLGTPDGQTETLSQLEAAVESPHLENVDLTGARDEVSQAIAGGAGVADVTSQPIEALNAQQFGGDLHTAPVADSQANNSASPGPNLPDILNAATADPNTGSNPVVIPPPPADTSVPAPQEPQVSDSTAPPPVPPPIPFQFGTPGNAPS
jgi:hypothetical protein